MRKLIIFSLFFCGCVSEKKLNDKAFFRIITNSELSNKTFAQLEKEHPCVVDSQHTIYIKGKDITTVDTIEVSYTLHDTLTNTDRQEVLKYINKIIKTTDTLKTNQADLRRLQLAMDSLFFYHGFVSKSNLEIQDLKKSVSEKEKSIFWWNIKFYGAILLLLLLIYLYFKK